MYIFYFFFFQAEDGIRDLIVTGVQTCALPILRRPGLLRGELRLDGPLGTVPQAQQPGDAVGIGVPAGWRHVHAARVSSRRLAARPSPAQLRRLVWGERG